MNTFPLHSLFKFCVKTNRQISNSDLLHKAHFMNLNVLVCKKIVYGYVTNVRMSSLQGNFPNKKSRLCTVKIILTNFKMYKMQEVYSHHFYFLDQCFVVIFRYPKFSDTSYS